MAKNYRGLCILLLVGCIGVHALSTESQTSLEAEATLEALSQLSADTCTPSTSSVS